MNNLISARTAGIILITIFTIVIFYHLLVMAGVLSFSSEWSGRSGTLDQLRFLESGSIFIAIFLIIIVSMKLGFINYSFSVKTVDLFLWVFIALFVLNTGVNFFAPSLYEKIVAAPITLVSAILLYLIVKTPERD